MGIPYDRDLRVEHVNNGLSFAIWWPDDTKRRKLPIPGRRWWFRVAFLDLEPLMELHRHKPIISRIGWACADRVLMRRAKKPYAFSDGRDHNSPYGMWAEVTPDVLRELHSDPKRWLENPVTPEIWDMMAAMHFRMAIQNPAGKMLYFYDGAVFKYCGPLCDMDMPAPRPVLAEFDPAAPMAMLNLCFRFHFAEGNDTALAKLRADIIAEMKTLRDENMAIWVYKTVGEEANA